MGFVYHKKNIEYQENCSLPFESGKKDLPTWIFALRVKQWLKNEFVSREHLTLVHSTVSTKCLIKFECFCGCRWFSTHTFVISWAVTFIHCSVSPSSCSVFLLARDILLSPTHNTIHYKGCDNSFHFPTGRRRRWASSGRPNVLHPRCPNTKTLSAYQHPKPGVTAPRKQGKNLLKYQT